MAGDPGPSNEQQADCAEDAGNRHDTRCSAGRALVADADWLHVHRSLVGSLVNRQLVVCAIDLAHRTTCARHRHHRAPWARAAGDRV